MAFKNYKSIATVSLCGTLTEKLEAVADAGFQGIELFENDLLYFNDKPEQISRIANELGLKILLFQPFRDFEGVPREYLQKNLERAKRKFDLMNKLGVDTLLVCSNVMPNALLNDEVIIGDLTLLAEHAQQHGVKIGYEALAWGTYVKSYRHAWKIVRSVANPALGIILDSFHSIAINDDLWELAAIPADKIFFVQLADAPQLSKNFLEWSRHFRCYPGQGDFDVVGFVTKILKTGYMGPLSFEIFNDRLKSASPKVSAFDGMRSMKYLEEKVTNALILENKRSTLKSSKIIFNTNSHKNFLGEIKYDRIEFLEFSADLNVAKHFMVWLEQFGFKKIGSHRSKQVSLLRHGDINIILNSEPDSFAHRYFLSHGLSLCAIGLKVSNLEEVLGRAQYYGCQIFYEKHKPNECHVPAIKAPDDSLIYFIAEQGKQQDLYQTDFIISEDIDKKNSYLLDIESFSLALLPETVDSWVLFFRTILNFATDKPYDVVDPYGIVRSKTVQSKCKKIKVSMNISESKNTFVAQSISGFQGEGVHNVVFRTENIFLAASRINEKNLLQFRVPKNYYDDLKFKFDLTDEFIERLAQYNLYYDRDLNGGEILNCYYEPIVGNVSIEIVQRRNYEQNCLPNITTRLAVAAQYRNISPFANNDKIFHYFYSHEKYRRQNLLTHTQNLLNVRN